MTKRVLYPVKYMQMITGVESVTQLPKSGLTELNYTDGTFESAVYPKNILEVDNFLDIVSFIQSRRGKE